MQVELGSLRSFPATPCRLTNESGALACPLQLLAATQFIVEEKYLVKYRAPVLLAVCGAGQQRNGLARNEAVCVVPPPTCGSS